MKFAKRWLRFTRRLDKTDKSEPPEAGDVVEAGGARAPWTANGRERAVGCVGTVW